MAMPSPPSPFPFKSSRETSFMSMASASLWARAEPVEKMVAIDRPRTPTQLCMLFIALLHPRVLRGAPAGKSVGQVGPPGAALGVGDLVAAERVVLEGRALLRLVAVEARVVAAEDRVLDRPVGGAERREAMLLLQ